MVAPKRISLVRDWPKSEKDLIATGTGQNTWQWWTTTRHTTRTGSSNGWLHTDTKYGLDDRYTIHCSTCLKLGCSGSSLTAAPKPSGSHWKMNMIGHHVHASADKENHHSDCPCWNPDSGINPNKYESDLIRRKVVAPSVKLSISNEDDKLRFAFEVPEMTVSGTNSPISDSNRMKNYNIIKEKVERSLGHVAVLDRDIFSNNIITGTLHGIPKAEYIIVDGKNILSGNPNVERIILKFFDPDHLDLLVWKIEEGFQENILSPVNIEGIYAKNIRMDLSGSHYIWTGHRDYGLFRNLLDSDAIFSLNNDQINNFVETGTEKTKQVVEAVFGNYGYSVEYNESDISANLVKIDNLQGMTHAIILCNNTEEDLMPSGELHAFGIKSAQWDNEELSKYDLSIDENKHIQHWKISKKETRIFPVKISGSGRFMFKIDTPFMRLLFAETIFDDSGKEPLILEKVHMKKNLDGVIPAIMKASGIKGFENYLNIPDQDDWNEQQLVDVLRHRFTDSENKNELVHSASISLALNKLNKIPESWKVSEVNDSPKKTHLRFPYLFEAQYNKISEKEESLGIWKQRAKGNFKLVGYDEGYFAPESTKWALLISRKSWSQLKEKYPEITSDDVKFLKTGHRLILSKTAKRITMNKLQSIPGLDIYPDSAVEFLLAHFDESSVNSEDDSIHDEEPLIGWLHMGSESAGNYLSLYSENLTSRPKSSGLWTSKKESELMLKTANNETWYLSIQRLAYEPRFEEDEDKWSQRFILHLSKCNKDEEYETHSVTIFNSRSPTPVGLIKDYFQHRGPDDKRNILHQHLRDVMRAYISASDGLSKIKNPSSSLAPFNYRKTLLSPESGKMGFTFNEIYEEDSELAKSLSNYVKERLWLK